MDNSFLLTDNFISEANKNFDEVLIENTFSENSDEFLSAVAYHTRQEKKILVVIYKTPVDIIFPMIQSGKSNATIINSSCGATGFANKGFWDIWDISKARDFGLQIIEPIYQEELVELFESIKSSTYIRINEHTPWKDQLPEIKGNLNGFVNFQKQGYSGTHGTILCFGSILIEALYGAGYLQEEGIAMDVFSNSNPFFKINEEFKDSLRKTSRLIVIMDQHLGSLYDVWLMSNLWENGLRDISITFITPYYQKISSLSLEYMYEQASIDGVNIAKRIK